MGALTGRQPSSKGRVAHLGSFSLGAPPSFDQAVMAEGERKVDEAYPLLNVLSSEERPAASAHTPLATLDGIGVEM